MCFLPVRSLRSADHRLPRLPPFFPRYSAVVASQKRAKELFSYRVLLSTAVSSHSSASYAAIVRFGFWTVD